MTKKVVTIAMNKHSTPRIPVLRFCPTAWAKLLFLRDAGETEIGGFGITSPDDPLLVESIELIDQKTSTVHVEFLDTSVADFFDAQVDAGRRPEQFARIWIHTHPGSSPEPSFTDEATFARVFGRTDWALMFILARGGQSYARLRLNVGPGAELIVPVDLEFRPPFGGSEHEAWEAEYVACVRPEPKLVKRTRRALPEIAEEPARLREFPAVDDEWYDAWYDYTVEDQREALNGYFVDF
jgi:proteasome lid subunit RPN8/RPN11